ncbi:MAG: oligosaccharide flippase family protein [Candidatus Paceibacterota bacterium]|jgi:O-antigen/teichoic acid export membrane protein
MVNRFLDKAQKVFKVDIRYVIKGNFWLNVNRVISIANGLILSTAFARLLTKEDYGIYAFVLAIIGLISTPLTSGLGAGIIKGVSRGNHMIIFEGMKRILPWSIGGGALLVLVGGYYGIMGNATLAICVALGGLTLPVSVSNGIAKSFLSVKGDFDRLTRFNLWRTPLMTAILVIAAWASSSPLIILIASILGNTVISFSLYRNMRKSYSFDPQQTPSEGFASRFAFHSTILSMFGYLSEKIDNLLLWQLMGAAPVAAYTYATTPVRELRSLLENQSVLALPKFAQKELHEVRSNISRRIGQMYLIAIPLAGMYALFAPLIFRILFPQYIDVVPISQLAAISLLSAPRRLLNVSITAHQRVKESYITTIMPSMIRIILAMVFIPMFGITGAVIALLLTELSEYIILGILIKAAKPGTAKQAGESEKIDDTLI